MGEFRTYDPLGILKSFGPELWIADGGVIWMDYPVGAIPFTTRMVVVRLPGDLLWLWSPIEIMPSLQDQVDALGRVAHIVSPNAIHYAHIPEWSHAYPEARVWAAPGVHERALGQGTQIAFSDELTDAAPHAWRDAVDQHIFKGSRLLPEVTFYHRASRTLILADLIENFEPGAMPRFYDWMMRLAGSQHPDGKLPIDLRLTYLGHKATARQSLDHLLAWQPEKIIIAHGRCYEENGVAELERAFRWLR